MPTQARQQAISTSRRAGAQYVVDGNALRASLTGCRAPYCAIVAGQQVTWVRRDRLRAALDATKRRSTAVLCGPQGVELRWATGHLQLATEPFLVGRADLARLYPFSCRQARRARYGLDDEPGLAEPKADQAWAPTPQLQPGKARRMIFTVFDLTHMVRRAFHGRPDRAAANAIGWATSCLRRSWVEGEPPTHAVACVDAGRHTWRHALEPTYKQHRKPLSDDQTKTLWEQQQQAEELLLDCFGIPTVRHPEYEADDLAATFRLAVLSREPAGQCMLVSGDKDFIQLMDQRVEIVRPNDRWVRTMAEVAHEYQVRPDQWVDYQALVGDASDGYPGVPNVGAKKAAALLERYGTLEGILQAGMRTDDLLAAHVREHEAAARRCRRLARLDDRVPGLIPPPTPSWADAWRFHGIPAGFGDG